MRGRQAFLSFPEPSSRSLSVRSLILCSVEGLLPLFLLLSLSDCEAVHNHCTHTYTHTRACMHTRTGTIRVRWPLILVHFESPLHNLLTFSRDPFSTPNAPPPHIILSFVALLLWSSGSGGGPHIHPVNCCVLQLFLLLYIFCYASMLFIMLKS